MGSTSGYRYQVFGVQARSAEASGTSRRNWLRIREIDFQEPVSRVSMSRSS